ncbi:UNVERIFIED_CONTAM: hypothetical protein Sradi_5298800 [Sesamum radiatum]|uniref:Transposase MuDR plant domain-containing protein n=1 Tax=Sesamum radiatum TaxID=300843 RepID=A0AAW2LMX1_SESRA
MAPMLGSRVNEKQEDFDKTSRTKVANDLENVEGGNEGGLEEGATEEGVEGDDDDGTDEDGTEEEGVEGDYNEGNEGEKHIDSDVCLSGYESDNYCEVVNSSDEEFLDDPFVGLLNKDRVTIPKNPMQKIKLEKGMVFTNVDMFREVLKEYVIREGFQIKRIKNEKSRVTIVCAAEECSWRVHVSPLPDGETFMIKTLEGKHPCVRTDKIKEASVSWMANKLIDVSRENPDMKARGLRNETRKFGVTPPYMQLYRAKKMAIDIIEGGHASSYGLLSAYAKMVEKTNPKSLVKLQYHTNVEGRPIESIREHLLSKEFS